MDSPSQPGIGLRALLTTVGQPLVELISSTSRRDTRVTSLALVEVAELRERSTPAADALLLVGAREEDLPALLPLVGSGTVVFIKLTESFDVDEYASVLRAAAARNVRVVRVHHEAGWDQFMSILQRLLSDTARMGSLNSTEAVAEEVGDLFALAETVAVQVKGLVTIEETGGEVLAYSRANEGADELRISSILGRRGPAEQMRRLGDEGILAALAGEGGVLRMPANPALKRSARLAVGIHSEGEHLGILWVQQGLHELAVDAETLLPGAARLAAELMRERVHAAHSGDNLVLAGVGLSTDVHSEVVTEPSVAERYALATLINPGPGDTVALIGFTFVTDSHRSVSAVMSYLRLHAASYRRPIALAARGERIYGVVATSNLAQVERWATSALDDAAVRFGPGLRAALVDSPEGMGGLVGARRSADHLLDSVIRDPARYPVVVSLAAQRSEALLREMLLVIAANPSLRDPRLDALREQDERHGSQLVPSIRAYLDALGDVRAAALALGVHPNTLRYRIRRAQLVSALDLGDSVTRVVMNILLRL
ncbi:helix-turn-helix domain-containing protein [Lysinibacter sp. HNR]|uniref:helix-turn-helix domain-containing protein n=1 Tax=Lysinibacter sp. HNR TaxID=3031408 RepID=UPI0024359764|nr:helix-turn-helix domain-containing protein [Lysinibacter sp. HNR]WGD37462.1 helix-turn-helix domain-containing protein [Lysinibacter sp. HNR]